MPEPTLLTASLDSAPRMGPPPWGWPDGTFLWCTPGAPTPPLLSSERPLLHPRHTGRDRGLFNQTAVGEDLSRKPSYCIHAL